ncbi:hypothetical protein P879_10190 [Paragonimus westermani]|uniref:Protein N-terminal glutamine amidohydrolase n=1 Tax=Paragonimus westermani TaxID=34504 RepID=A0A8T0D3G3_9TREM|nr:hypothetical protein P879_10190 [Paragonimus westermani]
MASQPYRRTDFIYTPNYCEENVYLLLQKLQADQLSGEFHVVFVSNSSSSVALFAQSKGDPESDHMIVWDYHVFLIHTAFGSHWVFDFDTVLEFPVSFSVYRKYGLRENALLPDRFRRLYRVISGSLFLEHFASDRRHMRRPNGDWIAPPPVYDCLRGAAAKDAHTLPHFLDMTLAADGSDCSCYGTVLNESLFFAQFD